MTKRFQHQPSFISPSTCLLWGLPVFCLPFFKTLLCWELVVVARWWWGFPFMWEGVNTFLDRELLGLSRYDARLLVRTMANTTHDDDTYTYPPHALNPPPARFYHPPLPIFSLPVASFSLPFFPSLSHSTLSLFFFPALCYLTHTCSPYIQHLEQNNTEHLYYSIGWLLLIFFPIYFFLSSKLGRAVGLCQVIGHAISSPFRFFLVNGSLFISLFFVCLALQMF
ncbi:hypothetical protein HOY80DRAFT_374353 [Tuber brumale]|nr:hypothetical protein HOY80DRAFT_374353 [Tuber brumale]